MEQREYERYPVDIEIECGLLTTRKSISTTNGRILNFSSDGIFAELDSAFMEGSLVMVKKKTDRMKAHPKSSQYVPSARIAEVKWSRDLPETGGDRYATGLQYVPADGD